MKKQIVITSLFLIVGCPELFAQSLWHEQQMIYPSALPLWTNWGTCTAIDEGHVVVGGGVPHNVSFFAADSAGVWNNTANFSAVITSSETYAAAIDGQYAVVGKAGDFNAAGSVLVFERDSAGTWTMVQQIMASDGAEDDFFGVSVSISGTYIAVGATLALPSRGAVYIFERDSLGTWQETQKLFPLPMGRQFGASVCLDGTQLAVLDPQLPPAYPPHTTTAGSIYMYELDSLGQWVETQRMTPSDSIRGMASIPSGIMYKRHVYLHGEWMIYGVPLDSKGGLGDSTIPYAGAAYFFKKNAAGIWQETQKVMASDRSDRKFFGCEVALNGRDAVISAETASGVQQQVIYAFRENGGIWTEVQRIAASNGALTDGYGHGIALDAHHVVSTAISRPFPPASIYDKSGAAYIYERCAVPGDTLRVTACDTFAVPSGNHVWSSSGFYTDLLTSSVLGCDSIITIDLTIATSDTAVVTDAIALTAVDSTGEYQWLDCDQGKMPIPGATQQAFSPTSSGYYAVEITNENKCQDTSACFRFCLADPPMIQASGDSLMTTASPNSTFQWLDCDQGYASIAGATTAAFTPPSSGHFAVQTSSYPGCRDTSSCFRFLTVGLLAHNMPPPPSLSPNPTNGWFRISLDWPGAVGITIRNSLGQIVHKQTHLHGAPQIEGELTGMPGVYTVTLTSSHHQPVAFKVLKL